MLLAILTREIVTTKWAAGLRKIAMPANSGVSFYSGAPFDVARNTACENTLKHDFQWLLFLDDDVIPPEDVVGRLVGLNKDIVSGLYYRRQEPVVPVAKTFNGADSQWVTSWNPPNSLLEVDLVGAGCLLIHRRVLERVAKPWFDWEIGRDAPADRNRPALSEDFAFCMKAREAGFKIYLDTSTRCEHIGLGQASEAGFRPASL